MSPQAALSKANSKLAAIQEVVKSAAGSGVSELLALPCAPPLTWNVLKAMLLVMGKPPHDIDTWLKCRSASGDKHLPFEQHFLLSNHDTCMQAASSICWCLVKCLSCICGVLTAQSAALMTCISWSKPACTCIG